MELTVSEGKKLKVSRNMYLSVDVLSVMRVLTRPNIFKPELIHGLVSFRMIYFRKESGHPNVINIVSFQQNSRRKGKFMTHYKFTQNIFAELEC